MAIGPSQGSVQVPFIDRWLLLSPAPEPVFTDRYSCRGFKGVNITFMRIHVLTRLLLLATLLLLPPVAAQAAPAGPQSFLPSQQQNAGNKRAIASVKQRYPGVRVLSVNAVERRGGRAFRVKTLNAEGVVKFVFVDSRTGQVVE